MSNYIIKDTKRYIIDEFLRQAHNPNNKRLAVEVGILLALNFAFIFLPLA